MTFVRQAGAAAVLVTLTLCLQCAGMVALIAWARTTLKPEVHRLGPFRSALLMVRFITAFILAPIRNSALGRVLSLVLFSIASMRVRYVVSDSVPIHLNQASFHLISQHTRISIPMRQARSTIFNQAPLMAKSRSFLTRIDVGAHSDNKRLTGFSLSHPGCD